jgi:DNA-binding transcriptional ArsR family regulator
MINMSTECLTARPYALLFQALANTSRMQILIFLRNNGSSSVSQICNGLGLEQTQVSHNLKCLTFCGLVTVERRGKLRIYSLNSSTMFSLFEIADRHIREYANNLCVCEQLER